MARIQADKQSQARIQELALALDNEALQRSAEMQRLGQEGRRSAATGLEVMRSCLGSIDQLSCSLEKETQDREALEASVRKAMTELQVDFKSLDKDVTSFKETCVENVWSVSELEGQMKELQEGLERESHERKQDKTGTMELKVDLDKAYKLIMDEVATLSKALKAELEALVDNVLTDLEEQNKQIDDMKTKMKDRKAPELLCPSSCHSEAAGSPRSPRSPRNATVQMQQLEDQQTQLDDIARKINSKNTRAFSECSNEVSSECSTPRSANQTP